MKMGSFHWTGKDKRGVSHWTGGWNNLPKAFTRGFLGYGIVAGIGGLSCLIAKLLNPDLSTGLWTLALVGIIHFFAFGLTGFFMDRLRQRIDTLTPANTLCQKIGVSPETLATFAQDNSITPKYNINGQDFYDLSEFTEAETLLRASSMPDTPETLLRPAHGSAEITSKEELLRASDPLTQRITKSTEEENILLENRQG